MDQRFLDSVLQGRRSQPQQLIEVLLDVQEAANHISPEVMNTVSLELGVPLIEVYRVAHFYKAFSLTPQGKHRITLCEGTACHVRGANPMLDQVVGKLGVKPGETTDDGLFTVECVNCLGACALGPVVVLDGAYHHHMTPAALGRMIESVRKAEAEISANAFA